MSASPKCLDSSFLSKIFEKNFIQSVLTAENKLFNFFWQWKIKHLPTKSQWQWPSQLWQPPSVRGYLVTLCHSYPIETCNTTSIKTKTVNISSNSTKLKDLFLNRTNVNKMSFSDRLVTFKFEGTVRVFLHRMPNDSDSTKWRNSVCWVRPHTSNHLYLPSPDWPIFWIRNFVYLC